MFFFSFYYPESIAAVAAVVEVSAVVVDVVAVVVDVVAVVAVSSEQISSEFGQ